MDNRLLLKNAMLCDSQLWNAPMDVLVENGHIAAIGQNLPGPGLELTSYTLLPGFIDAHVHLVTGNIEYNDISLQNWARAGVTFVRDLGLGNDRPLEDFIAWRDTPRDAGCCGFVSSGRFIARKNGLGHIMPDGAECGLGCQGEEQVAAAVNYLAKNGFHGVKTQVDPKRLSLNKEEIAAMVKAASANGMWACAHVLDGSFVPMLLDAGIRELAHMPLTPLPDETLKRMVDDDVTVTATLYVNSVEPPPLPPEAIPPAMREKMKHIPPPDPADREAKTAIAVDNVRRFHAMGGQIAMGTDTMRMETSPAPVGMPVGELRLLHEAGLSLQEVVKAATETAARVCHVFGQMGSFTVGKMANIIGIKEPLDGSFSALENVCLVMNKGEIIRHE